MMSPAGPTAPRPSGPQSTASAAQRSCRRVRARALPALLAALCLATAAGADIDAAPQTRTQRDVVRSASRGARAASLSAAPRVRALLAAPATTEYLALLDDGSALQQQSADRLAQRLWQEMEAAEVVHNFGDGDSDAANCGYDLSVVQGARAALMPNQWQLQAFGEVPVDPANNDFMEWSEVNIFGFPPFENTSDPDGKTSTDRPYYGALNMYRASGGNPQCGPVAAILNRDALDPDILATPVDTGMYNGECKDGEETGGMGNETFVICDAWPEPWQLGVLPYIHHLLEPYIRFYNQTQPQAGAEHYPNLNLARLTTRLLSRFTYAHHPGRTDDLDKEGHHDDTADNGDVAMRLNFVENMLGYFELNPAAIVTQASGVKMMVGMFELLWGTSTGDALVAWCISRDWPLAWASNPTMSYFRCGPDLDYPECNYPSSFGVGMDKANVRILDPRVLRHVSAGHNMSDSTTDMELKAFRAFWHALSAEDANREQMVAGFEHLAAQHWDALAIEPMFFGTCADSQCVGAHPATGACVCPLLDENW